MDIKVNKKKQNQLNKKIKKEAFFIWPEINNGGGGGGDYDDDDDDDDYDENDKEYLEWEMRHRKFERRLYIKSNYTNIVKDLIRRQNIGEDISDYWPNLLAETEPEELLKQREYNYNPYEKQYQQKHQIRPSTLVDVVFTDEDEDNDDDNEV